jgi:hypothetical protein
MRGAPLPVIGVRGTWLLSQTFSIDASGQFFSLTYGDIDGNLQDYRVVLKLAADNAGCGLGIGYDHFAVNVERGQQQFQGQDGLGVSRPDDLLSMSSEPRARTALDGDAGAVGAMLAGGTARLGRGPSRSPAADRELQHRAKVPRNRPSEVWALMCRPWFRLIQKPSEERSPGLARSPQARRAPRACVQLNRACVSGTRAVVGHEAQQFVAGGVTQLDRNGDLAGLHVVGLAAASCALQRPKS